MMDNSLYDSIYRCVIDIPAGKVATYGQIARVIGKRGYARQIGYALSALSADSEVPWHRVVNAKGEISKRKSANYETKQRERLLCEGIRFDSTGRVNLQLHQHHFKTKMENDYNPLDWVERNP